MTILSREWGIIKAMYANGGRGLLIANAYFLGGLFILSAAILYALVSHDEPYKPLRNISPQTVLTPVVVQGGTLIVEAYKCNDSDEPVSVSGISSWRNLDTREIIIRNINNGAVRDPGCPLLHFENRVPIDLPPGRYHLEGVETVLEGERVQREAWRTEEFVVTEGPHE